MQDAVEQLARMVEVRVSLQAAPLAGALGVCVLPSSRLFQEQWCPHKKRSP